MKKRMRFIKPVLFFILGTVLLLLCTCFPEHIIVDGSYEMPVIVQWENVPVGSRESMIPQFITQDEVTSLFSGFYASLGKRITFNGKTGLTPTRFRLGVGGIQLNFKHDYDSGFYSGGNAPMYFPDVETNNHAAFHVDFFRPETRISKAKIINMNFNDLAFNLITVNKITDYPQYINFPVLFKPSVMVDIPGYDNITLPDVYSAGFQKPEDNPIDGTVLYERQWISGSTFHFTPGFLMPNFTKTGEVITPYRPYFTEPLVHCMDYNIFAGRVLPVEWFGFDDQATEITGGFTGFQVNNSSMWPAYVLRIDNTEPKNPFSVLKFPFNGLYVDAAYFTKHKCSRVVVTIGMDMREIIEVYDNNTTQIQFDDIVVLADGWWNRFSINVSYE